MIQKTFDERNRFHFKNDDSSERELAQLAMLRDYIHAAHESVKTRQDITDVKQQRLHLAESEFSRLSNVLKNEQSYEPNNCNSTYSIANGNFNEAQLRAEVEAARKRVDRLRQELSHANNQLTTRRNGIDPLQRIETKIASPSYETLASLEQLNAIKQNVSRSQKEKQKLIQMVLGGSDALRHTTDVGVSIVPHPPTIGSQLAEKAKLGLQKQEAQNKITSIQLELQDIDNKIKPMQTETDKDRLLLIQEKENLLKDLKAINSQCRSTVEQVDLKNRKQKLMEDIDNAKNESNRIIHERLKLEERKRKLQVELNEVVKVYSYIEHQMLNLSSASLASSGQRSSASSQSLTSSNLSSLSDIYTSSQLQSDCNISDLKSKADRLLQSDPYPFYDTPHSSFHNWDCHNGSEVRVMYPPVDALEPISENDDWFRERPCDWLKSTDESNYDYVNPIDDNGCVYENIMTPSTSKRVDFEALVLTKLTYEMGENQLLAFVEQITGLPPVIAGVNFQVVGVLLVNKESATEPLRSQTVTQQSHSCDISVNETFVLPLHFSQIQSAILQLDIVYHEISTGTTNSLARVHIYLSDCNLLDDCPSGSQWYRLTPLGDLDPIILHQKTGHCDSQSSESGISQCRTDSNASALSAEPDIPKCRVYDEGYDDKSIELDSVGLTQSSTVRRSATFSPGPDNFAYKCRLNRSDSDPATHNVNNSFSRHASERRSMRMKRPNFLNRITSSSSSSSRTPVDLELDLEAFKLHELHINDEVSRLRAIKEKMEKQEGGGYQNHMEPISGVEKEYMRHLQRKKHPHSDIERFSKQSYKLIKSSFPDHAFREKLDYFTINESERSSSQSTLKSRKSSSDEADQTFLI